MSWIQENKFVAGLAGATAVIGGAILFFGVSQGSAYNEKLEKFEELKGRYVKLEKGKPYPTSGNLSDREDGIADYETAIKDVRNLVTGYRPEKLERMTPEQFKDVRVNMEAELQQAFKDAGTRLPEGCLFGFEKYDTDSVRATATAKLHYELGAIQWMLTKLAEVKPDAITNILRTPLAEESAKAAAPAATTRRGGRANNNRAQKAPTASGRAYEMMPMEIAFTASESAIREFLIGLVNSDQYYYAIRGVRIRNEKQLAPNQKDADFPADVVPDSVDDGFGALEELGEEADFTEGEGASEDATEVAEDDGSSDPVQPAIPAGELLLKQVLGSEKLHVHICFDIILIEKKAAKPKAGRRSSTDDADDADSDDS